MKYPTRIKKTGLALTLGLAALALTFWVASNQSTTPVEVPSNKVVEKAPTLSQQASPTQPQETIEQVSIADFYEDDTETSCPESKVTIPKAPEVSFSEVTDIAPIEESFKVEPTKPAKIRHKRSGTIIHIPEMALVDKEGNTIEEPVTVTYREFRDAPDFVLSDIPMTYEDENGEAYRFSSTGMFELRASAGGEEVFIREGANIAMEFAMTAAEPNTNFYAYSDETGKWTELGKITEKGVAFHDEFQPVVIQDWNPQPNDLLLGKGVVAEGAAAPLEDLPLFNNQLSTRTDTLSTMIRVLDEGLAYAKSQAPDIFKTEYPFDVTPYRDRTKSLDYWGTTAKAEVKEEEKAGYEIGDFEFTSARKNPTVKMNFKNGKMRNLRGFQNPTWTILSKEIKAADFDQPFYGMEVRKLKELFEFTLKGEHEFVKFSAVPENYRKIKRRHKSWIAVTNHFSRDQRKEKRFNDDLNDQKREFSVEDAKNKREFWCYSGMFMSQEELKMDQRAWFAYFQKNQAEMLDRYTQASTSDWVNADMLPVMIKEKTEARIKDFEAMEADSLANIHWNWRNQRFRNQIWAGNHQVNQKFKEWDKGQVGRNKSNRGATLLASGMDAGHTYPELVRNLNVGSFGVFNCDQIYQLAQRETVTPTFIDEEGDTITTAAILSLIDYKFNGAFSFDPGSFTYNPGSKNAFVLFCEGKQTYVAEPEAFANADKRGSQATFRVKNMTETVKTTDQLREVLKL